MRLILSPDLSDDFKNREILFKYMQIVFLPTYSTYDTSVGTHQYREKEKECAALISLQL